MAAPLLRYSLLVHVALLVSVLSFPAAPLAQVAILHTVDRTSASTIDERAPGYVPTYVVYADSHRTPEQAQTLLRELGMMPHLEEYKARAFVVGPVNGASYDAEADLAAFKELLRTRRSSNLKIIGVGQGATFVNNVISANAFAVAGILTYGGSIDARAKAPTPVPAYVSAADPAVARLYRDANGATTVEEDAAGYTAYRNPGQHERLQRVVVSKREAQPRRWPRRSGTRGRRYSAGTTAST